jgi:hypothetical protein
MIRQPFEWAGRVTGRRGALVLKRNMIMTHCAFALLWTRSYAIVNGYNVVLHALPTLAVRDAGSR